MKSQPAGFTFYWHTKMQVPVVRRFPLFHVPRGLASPIDSTVQVEEQEAEEQVADDAGDVDEWAHGMSVLMLPPPATEARLHALCLDCFESWPATAAAATDGGARCT